MKTISLKVKISAILVIILWASAFVGIREGLRDYSPEGLALLRYLIASACMTIAYFRLPTRNNFFNWDTLTLFGIGALGIGFYNLTLNYGEVSVSSGMASFIVSQSPIITAIFAMFFLGEKLTFLRAVGFIVSILGVVLIAISDRQGFSWNINFIYLLLATLAGSLYTIFQKPFLKKYHAIEVTTYIIWGGTLTLLFFIPQLHRDLAHASWMTTSAIVYLGIFPAAIGYLAWSYILVEMPASRAISLFYFMPFIATLLGWACLGEMPVVLSLVGGLVAILGVWIVNKSFGAADSDISIKTLD
jgi:drug/metabolite transporter (DMT)-like permease